MKATIEQLRKEYREMLQKCYDFVKNEAHQSMRNKANRDVVDYYDDFACEIKKFLEQKLIQPEPRKVSEEGLHKKVLNFIKDKGYSNQAQTEHLFVVVDLIKEFTTQHSQPVESEPKQVTEDEFWNLKMIAYDRDYSVSERMEQVKGWIERQEKLGLSLQNK
jgi:hypothetical protein